MMKKRRTDMVDAKALELLKDKDFLLELSKAETAESAQELFASKGADVSIDELLALRALLKQNAGVELDDDELALVAGGAGEGMVTLIAGIETVGNALEDAAKAVGNGIASIFYDWQW
jgi:hypothetical protein